MKNMFLKISQKFTGKHLYQSLFFSKVAGLRLATLLKKRLWHRCFPANFCEIFKNTFFTEPLRMATYKSSEDLFCKRSLNIQSIQKKLIDLALHVIYENDFNNKNQIDIRLCD